MIIFTADGSETFCIDLNSCTNALRICKKTRNQSCNSLHNVLVILCNQCILLNRMAVVITAVLHHSAHAVNDS